MRQKKKSPKSVALENLKADSARRYRTEAGREVSFSTAYSRPDTPEYEQASSDLERAISKQKRSEEIKAERDARAKKKRVQALREGFKQALSEDPSNFIDLLAKGGAGISKEDVIDLVTDMTMSKGFDDSIFGGLPSVEVPSKMKEEHQKAEAKDQLDLEVGALTQELYLEKKALRKRAEIEVVQKGAELRREKIKDFISSLKNPFSPKKKEKAKSFKVFGELSELLLEGAAVLDQDSDLFEISEHSEDVPQGKDLLLKLKDGFQKEGIAFSEGMKIDDALEILLQHAKKIGLDVEVEEESLLKTVDSNKVKLKKLSEQAKTKSEKIFNELKDTSKKTLQGQSAKDRERLKKDPTLKVLTELKKVNLTDEEKKEKSESKKFYKERKLFRDKIISLKDPFGGAEKNREIRGLDKALDLLDEIPDDFVGDLSDGFEAASTELTEIFTDQSKSLSERLSELSKKSDELWSSDLNSLTGAELGRAIAAAAMVKAFVGDAEYGVPSAQDFVVKAKDPDGRDIEIHDQRMMESNTYSQVTRYKDTTPERRASAFEQLHYNLSKVRKDSAEAARLQSTLDGVVVSMLINKDPNIPSNRAAIDPYLLEMANNAPSKELFNAINISSKLDNGATPKQVREVQRDYFNTLNDKDFFDAVGGDSGPFSQFNDLFKENYCPDHPLNGDMAGQNISAGDVCPYPVAPAIKKILRDHITRTFSDHYTVVPSADRDSFSSSLDTKKKTQNSNLSRFLNRNKEEYLKILTHTNPEKREEALAFLLLKMRAANLEDLEFSGFSGKSLVGKDKQIIEKTKRDAILKLIKSADKESLKDVLIQVDKITESTSKPSSESVFEDEDWGGSFRFAKNNSNNSFIYTRIISDSKGKQMRRQATTYTDYQARGREFSVGMRVFPFHGGNADKAGVVMQVFPAIGMVDVEFPYGSKRFPVEDLVIVEDTHSNTVDSIPGGTGVTPVSASRVASLYLNKKKEQF
jgi:hypothetical protein